VNYYPYVNYSSPWARHAVSVSMRQGADKPASRVAERRIPWMTDEQRTAVLTKAEELRVEQ